MKVLFLLDCNINTLGGAQNSVKTLIRVLRENDIKTGIYMPYAPDGVSDKLQEKTDFTFLRRVRGRHTRFSQFFVEIVSLRKCISSFRPDIIHAQSARIAIMLGLMKRLHLFSKNIKIILTDRGYLPEYKKRIIIGLRTVVGVYDAVVTTTERNKTEWKKMYDCNNAICISNALDDDWFTSPKLDQSELKKGIGIHDEICIGFSGRYEEYKRWDTVLDICKKLSARKKVHFVVAITADAGKYRKEMQEYVKTLKRIFNKKIMTIIMDANRDQMMRFYDLIDIFVLTSRNESFGRTLIEAMARDTIVIGTNSGGVPEVVGNKDYLFTVGDASGAVAIIDRFIDNPKIVSIEKKKFFNFAQKQYREQTLTKKYMELYSEVLDG